MRLWGQKWLEKRMDAGVLYFVSVPPDADSANQTAPGS
jgi:hypothetical protein